MNTNIQPNKLVLHSGRGSLSDCFLTDSQTRSERADSVAAVRRLTARTSNSRARCHLGIRRERHERSSGGAGHRFVCWATCSGRHVGQLRRERIGQV